MELSTHLLDPKEIQVAAKPIHVGVGVEATKIPPNPDYDGWRIKAVDSPKIYVVMFGSAWWIPDPNTYNNLFRDWNGIHEFPTTTDLFMQVPYADQLSPGAVLARGASSPRVYLVTDGYRLWVTSPQAMDKYHFAWNRVVVVPDVLINFIPANANLG